MQRYFVNKENDTFVLKDGDYHHIKDVMRLKDKDKIICVYDGNGYLCRIHMNGTSYQIEVLSKLQQENELKKDVILYQAVIKNDHFDFVVQKATELGVTELIPTLFSRSVVKIDTSEKENKKIARYEKIIKEASEQSHRNKICKISPYQKVMDIVLDGNTLGLLAFEGNGNPSSFYEALQRQNQYQKIAVIVGPEGGFTQGEVDYLLKQGFVNISLGKRILRSETASLYALSVIGFYLEGVQYE